MIVKYPGIMSNESFIVRLTARLIIPDVVLISKLLTSKLPTLSIAEGNDKLLMDKSGIVTFSKLCRLRDCPVLMKLINFDDKRMINV